MPMTIYKLYGTAATDDCASLDIQIDGIITAIHMTALAMGVNAADEGLYAECSFLSTNTFSANDARGSLMIIEVVSGMLTSGMGMMAANASIASLEIPVAAGERIHMHISDIGTLSSRNAHAFLYVLDKGTPRIPGRRR